MGPQPARAQGVATARAKNQQLWVGKFLAHEGIPPHGKALFVQCSYPATPNKQPEHLPTGWSRLAPVRW